MAEEPQIFAYDGPTGWKLDTGDPRDNMFTVGGLTPADERRLSLARQHFTEARPEDFDQEHKDWVHRGTGERYRLVLFDPSLSEFPPDTGVTTFFVTGDEYLVYLRPVGVEARGEDPGTGHGRGGGTVSDQLKYTSASDWLAAKNVPGWDAGRRPISEHFNKPTPGELPPPVPTHYPVSFSMFAKSSRASERRRKVNQLLAAAGVRPRAR